jgi:hypothetical protein
MSCASPTGEITRKAENSCKSYPHWQKKKKKKKLKARSQQIQHTRKSKAMSEKIYQNICQQQQQNL